MPHLEDRDSLELATSESDPAESVVARDEAERQLATLAELPADQREVLIQRAAGFTPSEIQDRLGLSGRQYRKRVEKARRRLGT